MHLHSCIFFLFAFIFVAINADFGEPCTSVHGNSGICINLKQCPKLLNLVWESRNSFDEHQAALKVIQQLTCGFEYKDPYVCCSQAYKPTENDKVSHGGHRPPVSNTLTPVTSDFSTATVPTPTSTHAPITTSSPAPITTSSPAPITRKTKATQLPVTTTPEPTTTQPSSTKESSEEKTDKKLKLLPEDCGLVLTFKFFYGNRTDIDDFPWTALIQYDTPSGRKFACGGALISDRYVLTAAHCVSGLQPSWKVTGVRFGEYDISTDIDCLPDGGSDIDCAEEPLNVPIEEIIPHSEFEPENPNRTHDIALLRLAKKVSFTDFIKPICLPLVQPIPQRYYTSGWGKNIKRDGTNLKLMSYVTLDHPKSCKEKYRRENIDISQHQICAGVQSTEKSCIGDEGGPLMGIEERSNYLKRVTTFGVLSMNRLSDRTCEHKGWPGVYIKVLDYMPWILRQLKE